MMRVLSGALLFIATACGQASSNEQAQMENLVTQALVLQREKADLTVVDEAEYQGLFVTEDPITYAVRANYIRYQSGRVFEIMLIQVPANMPIDEPFITGRWRDGHLISSEVCELQGQTPRCEPLRTANRFPEIRDGGEDLLQHLYRSTAPGLQQQFNSRTGQGQPPPATSPPRVTTS